MPNRVLDLNGKGKHLTGYGTLHRGAASCGVTQAALWRAMLASTVALPLLAWSSQPSDAENRPDYYALQWFQYRAYPYRAYPAQPSPSLVRPRRAKSSPHHHKEPAEPAKHATEAPPKEPLQIVISIADQRVSLYGDGALVARSQVSTGMRGHPTPMGVFSIIQKHKWHHSNIYSGAPMPYMQRITWSGVALHAGVLPGYAASHGCIRLHPQFAVRLWGLTHIGTRVIVARRDVAPAEISHPALFTPKPDLAAAAPVDRSENRTEPPTKPPGEGVKTADAGTTHSDATKAADEPKAVTPGNMGESAAPTTPAAPRKPISIFISRKQSKLFVRQGFKPLFEAQVKFTDPDQPLGTHLFTAMEREGASMRWTVISLPDGAPRAAEHETARDRRGHHRKAERTPEPVIPPAPPLERARHALDRLQIPQDVVDRISELLVPQSSLIVSDNAVSGETGSDTDFIVLVH